MVLLTSEECNFGLEAADFNLPGVDGRNWSLQQCMGRNGL